MTRWVATGLGDDASNNLNELQLEEIEMEEMVLENLYLFVSKLVRHIQQDRSG
jgi:hypothetical protein